MCPMFYNKYQQMWLFVFFDLPTETRKERKASAAFRKNLLKDGFQMFQFSVYIRHCISFSNVDTHIERVRKFLPSEGKVCLASFTEKQFSDMKVFYCKTRNKMIVDNEQLLLF